MNVYLFFKIKQKQTKNPRNRNIPVPTHIAADFEGLFRKCSLPYYCCVDRCIVHRATGSDTVQSGEAARVPRSRPLSPAGSRCPRSGCCPRRWGCRRVDWAAAIPPATRWYKPIACVESEVCCTFSVLRGDGWNIERWGILHLPGF